MLKKSNKEVTEVVGSWHDASYADGVNTGYWHDLSSAEGVTKFVDTAKRQEDWLVHNLFRRDGEAVATELFGPSETKKWLLTTDKNETFSLDFSNSSYLSVSVLSKNEDLDDNKLKIYGIRFMGMFAEQARGLEQFNPILFSTLSEYPTDIYRRGGVETVVIDSSDDLIAGDAEDDSDVDVTPIVSKPRMK